MAEKPSVLIIGGLGYIGRFLALHIHKNNLASDVRVVDKVLPQLAWLAPEFDEACAGDKFMQADASREREYYSFSFHYPPTALFHLLQSQLCHQLLHPCESLADTRLDSNVEALARIYDRPDGKQFDYVFNCGGETRYSQEDEVYKLRSLELSLAVGKEAAKRGVKAFIELSTGMVYKSDSAASKETDKLKPWSKIATFKLKAEEELAKLDG